MISFIIPVFNEEKNIEPLFKEITEVMLQMQKEYEVIFVNDGSLDNTQKEIERLHNQKPEIVKGICLRKQFGKAAALHAGFQLAKGDPIFTLDGDLQDDPHEIPHFLEKLDEGYDMVSGWKQNRLDSFIKNNTSKIFNAVTNLISNVKLHDFNCGFKVYRAELAKSLNLYGELHRYIPVLASAQGYTVAELPVHHRVRHTGNSKYGPIRFLHGAFDLFTVLFLTKFQGSPLHFFGYIGLLFFCIGFLFALYLSGVKFIGHQSIGDRPLLLFSVMLMIMGVQIGVTGLVGEQITTVVHRNEPQYTIKKILQ